MKKLIGLIVAGVITLGGIKGSYALESEQLSENVRAAYKELPQKNLQETDLPNYAKDRIIVKLKEGKTLDDIKILNEKYGVISAGKLFNDSLSPQDVLDTFKKRLADLDAKKHKRWYWHLDKDSHEYKEYIKKIEKEKKELESQIKVKEDLIMCLEQRQLRSPNDVKSTSLENIYILRISENIDSLLMIEEYSTNSAVEYVQQDYKYKKSGSNLPNDTYVDMDNDGNWSTGQISDTIADMWGLKNIEADKAWEEFAQDNRPGYEFAGLYQSGQQKGTPVIVAVVDSGIHYKHSDLTEDININGILDVGEDSNENGVLDSNIWVNTVEIPNNDIDDDNNGYIDDYYGFDFAYSQDSNNDGDYNDPEDLCDSDPMDRDGHGTHVSGTIAALGNNNIGIIGVSPKAKIMSLKGLNDTGSGYTTDLTQGMIYAMHQGAAIINNSWGNNKRLVRDYLLEDVIRQVYAQGVIVVLAAGNSTDDAKFYNGQNMADPKPIVVAAVDYQDNISWFSNFGDRVDVVAPGSEILSLLAGYTGGREENSCIIHSGTSMASPHVAGVCALMLAKNPELTVTQVRQNLRLTADIIKVKISEQEVNLARVNAYNAITQNKKFNVKITSLSSDEAFSHRQPIEIKGTNYVEGFKEYQLFYGEGAVPLEWLPLNEISSNIIDNDSLGVLDVPDLSKISYHYSFKLVASTFDGHQIDDMVTVKIKNSPILTISSAKGLNICPSVFENKIVWQNDDGGLWNIYYCEYDPVTDSCFTKRIPSKEDESGFSINRQNPHIYGDLVVWEDTRYDNTNIYGYRDIIKNVYLYNLTTGKEIKLTSDINVKDYENYLITPYIWENKIVWNECRKNDSGRWIYLICFGQYDSPTDICKVETISSSETCRMDPQIHKNHIVWRDFRNELNSDIWGNWDIFLYDLDKKQEIQISDSLFNDRDFSVGEKGITWLTGGMKNGWDESLWTINFYDFAAKENKKIVDQSENSTANPRIWNNYIIYAQEKNSYKCYYEGLNDGQQFYVYDLTTDTHRQITDYPNRISNFLDEQNIKFSDGRIVWSSYNDIHLLKLNAPPIIEPVDNKEIFINKDLVFNISAFDLDKNEITLSAELSKSESLSTIGAVFYHLDCGKGQFVWRPDLNQGTSEGKVYYVVFKAVDSEGESTSETVEIKVIIPKIPEIITISPSRGRPGSYVKITGKNFEEKSENIKVQFFSGNITKVASKSLWDDNFISFVVPEDIEDGEYTIKVINKDAVESNYRRFTVISRIPEIYSVSQISNSRNFVITGNNFLDSRDEQCRIFIWWFKEDAMVLSWNNNRIVFRLPDKISKEGIYNLRIFTAAGWSKDYFKFEYKIKTRRANNADLDNDGDFDSADLVYLYRYICGFNSIVPFDWRKTDVNLPSDGEIKDRIEKCKSYLDVNKDGDLDIFDIVFINRTRQSRSIIVPLPWRKSNPNFPSDDEIRKTVETLQP